MKNKESIKKSGDYLELNIASHDSKNLGALYTPTLKTQIP
jgi:hypothetical protein